ncbi:hypothetical protein HPB50_025562 [Hyalomma asiaticum]|uniref:Uncharacterized protein n=1 Tax=Hyalomma asiaticum TaxID=266040 RepID=A0ACB7ST29_HYAAI|nr:hypothetical protein HPB50_025562 [Hyalomma asiaticum]
MAFRVLTPSWFRSIVGLPRKQQPQRTSQSAAVATQRQQETGVQGLPGAACPPTVVSPGLLPRDCPNAAPLQAPSPGPALEPADSVAAPPTSMAPPLPHCQRVPEASTRPQYTGVVTSQPRTAPVPVALGQTVVTTQQRCFRSSLWIPPVPQTVQAGAVPLLSADNTLVVVDGDFLKSGDEGPAENDGDVTGFCQAVIFGVLTVAAVFILCLVLYQLSSESTTTSKTSESPSGEDDSVRFEGLPAVLKRGAITRRGATDGVTTVPGLYDDVSDTSPGIGADADVTVNRSITESRTKMGFILQRECKLPVKIREMYSVSQISGNMHGRHKARPRALLSTAANIEDNDAFVDAAEYAPSNPLCFSGYFAAGGAADIAYD